MTKENRRTALIADIYDEIGSNSIVSENINRKLEQNQRAPLLPIVSMKHKVELVNK